MLRSHYLTLCYKLLWLFIIRNDIWHHTYDMLCQSHYTHITQSQEHITVLCYKLSRELITACDIMELHIWHDCYSYDSFMLQGQESISAKSQGFTFNTRIDSVLNCFGSLLQHLSFGIMDSCGQKFTYSRHGCKCQGQLANELLVISLIGFFWGRIIMHIEYIFV